MYNTPEQAYLGILNDVLAHGEDDGLGNLEILNHSFTIAPYTGEVYFSSKTRKFNHEFAQKFLDFILKEGTDASELFSVNPNAKNYSDELASRNTAYGPRISSQMPAMIEELKANNFSRRAVLTIIHPDDQILLPEKHLGCKMEYPCTVSLIFLIRKNKLHLHVTMRSNNVAKTINYDLYNFIGLQRVVLKKLQEAGMEVEIGKYFHVCASAHILQDEIGFASDIVQEWIATCG